MIRAGACATLVIAALSASPALAQESALGAEFRREGERLSEHCGGFNAKTLMSCAMTIATDHPIHLALGSIAPRNGFGLGVALVTSHIPNDTWRLGWSADAVGSLKGAWRTGAYMKLVHTPVRPITVVTNPGGSGTAASAVRVQPHTAINVYAQATSLTTLFFFGEGNDSRREDQTVFGLRETIVGSNIILPVNGAGALNLAVLGEVNGRFVALHPGEGDDLPQIETRFSEATAPGLVRQPGLLQFGEGVRIRPEVFGDRLRLNYLVQAQQFAGGGAIPPLPPGSTVPAGPFRRWTIDLDHEIPIYRTSRRVRASDANGPNECASTPGGACPSVSRDRYGAAGIRVLMISSSSNASGRGVPFYYQPTLGGSDINGRASLPSYDDYRFRGPHLILLQQTFEHSVYGPVGAYLQADQGKVTTSRGDLNLQRLRRSYAAGLTLRAGGFPQMVVSYAWGGTEGRHFSAMMSTSLLGGSARPRLD